MTVDGEGGEAFHEADHMRLSAHLVHRHKLITGSGECCGSGLLESGSGYESSISGESGSGVLMTKIEEEKIQLKIIYIFFLIKNCNKLIPRSS
jgi:hypothetical protein